MKKGIVFLMLLLLFACSGSTIKKVNSCKKINETLELKGANYSCAYFLKEENSVVGADISRIFFKITNYNEKTMSESKTSKIAISDISKAEREGFNILDTSFSKNKFYSKVIFKNKNPKKIVYTVYDEKNKVIYGWIMNEDLKKESLFKNQS